MKHILFLILILSFSTFVFSKDKKEVKKMNETYRNQFHFSPELNRMGSPISVYQSDTTYHLYFQHNSENLIDGFYNWSHASSSDFLKWDFHITVFTQPSNLTDSIKLTPWWGSIIKQENNVQAWVNRWSDGVYMSQSSDGYTWSEELKTIGTDNLPYSEPYVFWHEPTQKWVMFAFERPTTTMYILISPDGINWEETSYFNYNFGFPQIVQLEVDRKPGETRHVMLTDKGTYMVGKFDGRKFNIETTVLKSNYGPQVGGTIVFDDQKNKRSVAFSNVKSEQQADLGSNGFLTFPTEISLHESPKGLELHQKPITEISNLYLKTATFAETKIYPGIKNNILKKVKGKQVYIQGVIDLMNCDQLGFIIRSDRDKKGTEIIYNVKKKIFSIYNSQFDFEANNNKIEIEILIDRSSLEVYIDGGKYVYSTSFSPSPEAMGYELFCSGGEIMVEKMEVHQLKSVWREE